jgi:hypothetical protein
MNRENTQNIKENDQVQEAQNSADDDWELPGVACTLRPGMPGFDECEACQ